MKPQCDYRAELWRLMRFKRGLAAGAACLATQSSAWWLAAALTTAATVLLVLALMDSRTLGQVCRLDNEQRVRDHRAPPAG